MDYEMRLNGSHAVAFYVEAVPGEVCPFPPASVFLICKMAPQLWNRE